MCNICYAEHTIIKLSQLWQTIDMTETTRPAIQKMNPQFLVTDMDRSITFYTGTLGFELEFRYKDFYAGIIKDGCSIHEQRLSAADISIGFDNFASSFSGAGLSKASRGNH